MMGLTRGLLSLAILAILVPVRAFATEPVCDQLLGRFLTKTIDAQLQSLGCGDLAKTGLDEANHQLTELCYTSTGLQSTLTLTARLSCKTSDSAFIKASVSEVVSARATVDAATCSVLEVVVEPHGDIGRLLVGAFNAEGAARRALEQSVAELCQ